MTVVERIAVVREISTCPALLPDAKRIAVGDTFEITQFAQGAFGTLYRCTLKSPDLWISRTLPLTAVVVKLLRFGADCRCIADLHKAITKRADALPNGWKALLQALPFWIGEVKVKDELRTALICLDLELLGFVQFDQVLEEQWKEYHKLDFDKRVRLATSFAKSCALLEGLRFLHADINTENLFVNLQTDEAVLIDFERRASRERG